jgi:hypothetical protein
LNHRNFVKPKLKEEFFVMANKREYLRKRTSIPEGDDVEPWHMK